MGATRKSFCRWKKTGLESIPVSMTTKDSDSWQISCLLATISNCFQPSGASWLPLLPVGLGEITMEKTPSILKGFNGSKFEIIILELSWTILNSFLHVFCLLSLTFKTPLIFGVPKSTTMLFDLSSWAAPGTSGFLAFDLTMVIEGANPCLLNVCTLKRCEHVKIGTTQLGCYGVFVATTHPLLEAECPMANCWISSLRFRFLAPLWSCHCEHKSHVARWIKNDKNSTWD